jgi:Multicopper oxidase
VGTLALIALGLAGPPLIGILDCWSCSKHHDPGLWLFHCHLDDHMEAGMMARNEVLPAPADTKQSIR